MRLNFYQVSSPSASVWTDVCWMFILPALPTKTYPATLVSDDHLLFFQEPNLTLFDADSRK
ncbi:hypothetical protein L249_5858 [Ophiocordyceps polyrhachis-furcata BCC 54312]|uniref:Uncharacterized protein n=1 Tax=Ophiocordyceps polyrhachis-furcata BCC 54312 TaxID=1330021 RepID=A0A367L0G9_9HYPO|nr:hypothetical protein L249_5858 [Ophiocordyceps polyrhachis-furcata BCC 54312]